MFEFMTDPFGTIHQILDTDSEVIPLCALLGFHPDEFTIEESDVELPVTCVHCLRSTIDLLNDEIEQLRMQLHGPDYRIVSFAYSLSPHFLCHNIL